MRNPRYSLRGLEMTAAKLYAWGIALLAVGIIMGWQLHAIWR